MRCVLLNCDSDSNQTSQDVTYHLFPTEPLLRAAWLEALRLSDWELEECSTVCSRHFQRKDLRSSSSGQPSLRSGAVPVVDMLVCRICFATDCKMYSMKTCKILYNEYETLTGFVLDNDKLPSYLCSECALRLLNCAHFRTTSLRAYAHCWKLSRTAAM